MNSMHTGKTEVGMMSAVCLFLLGPAFLFAQSVAPIIISPPSGTIVAPGSSLVVTVDVPQGVKFQAVGIVLKDPLALGSNQLMTAPPYRFTVIISNTGMGIKTITAVGLTAPGQGTFSAAVPIDVEAAATVTSIAVSPAVALKYPGDAESISVTATLSDQTKADITLSTRTTYTSSNISVATVDRTGLITATGPGTATVLVANGGLQQNVPVTVLQSIQGDLNGDGRVDIDDLNILDSVLNTPANGPNDARDLNHDGKIDALDARILETLCTYLRCATHQ